MTDEPDYQRIAREIRRFIRAEGLKVNDQLPTYGEVATRYKVSSTTARAAISELRAAGIVRSHQGKGLFVAAVPDQESATGESEMRARLDEIEATVTDLASRTASPETSQRLDNHEQRIADLELQVMEIRARFNVGQPRQQQQRPRKAANQ